MIRTRSWFCVLFFNIIVTFVHRKGPAVRQMLRAECRPLSLCIFIFKAWLSLYIFSLNPPLPEGSLHSIPTLPTAALSEPSISPHCLRVDPISVNIQSRQGQPASQLDAVERSLAFLHLLLSRKKS